MKCAEEDHVTVLEVTILGWMLHFFASLCVAGAWVVTPGSRIVRSEAKTMPPLVRRDVALIESAAEPLVLAVQTFTPNAEIAALQAGTSLFASVFGFGDAILAMPLLGLVFGLEAKTAAPLVTLVSTLMICTNLVVDFRSGKMTGVGRWEESACLLAGAVVGVPVGVNALVSIDPQLLRALVGVLLVCYAGRQLTMAETAQRPSSNDLQSLLFVIPFGFAAGVLSGAVAEPGPPAVVLGQSRRWGPETMRVMLMRFFLPVQVLSLVDLQHEGLLTTQVLVQAAAAVPGVAAACALGTALNRRIDPSLFSSIVAGIVLCLGVLCLGSSAPHVVESLQLEAATTTTSTSLDATPVLQLEAATAKSLEAATTKSLEATTTM